MNGGWYFLSAIAIVASLGATATAQQAVSSRTGSFDIAALPLDDALTRYVRLTGVQVLYDSAITRGKISAAVRGEYSYREALLRMLRGTGLLIRYTETGAVFIARPDAEESRSLVPIGRIVVRERIVARPTALDRFTYYERLKAELGAAIRSDSRTRRLIFALTVAVKVSAQGRIETVSVRHGSTNAGAKVIAVIKETIVTPPPHGIAQPIAIRIDSQTR